MDDLNGEKKAVAAEHLEGQEKRAIDGQPQRENHLEFVSINVTDKPLPGFEFKSAEPMPGEPRSLEYAEHLERDLHDWCANLWGSFQMQKKNWRESHHLDINGGALFSVALNSDRLRDLMKTIIQGAYTGVWMQELIDECKPQATALMPVGSQSGIENPEQLYIGVPPHICEGLKKYVADRIATGSFLRACLENNLMVAAIRADAISGTAIPQIMKYIHNELPSDSHGSADIVSAWLAGDDES